MLFSPEIILVPARSCMTPVLEAATVIGLMGQLLPGKTSYIFSCLLVELH